MSRPTVISTGWRRIFAGTILCVLAAAGGIRAQQTTPAAAGPPPLPSLKPKTPAHWVINYQQKDNPPAATPGSGTPAPASRRLVKEEYILDGQTAVVNRVYSDGVVQKTYIVKGIAFITNPDTQRVRALMLHEGVGRDLRFGSTYPGFEWLKNDFFVDVPEQNGRKLAHYRQGPTKGKGGTTFDPYATETEREAWVDEDSQMPFAFREGKVSGVYQFEAASAEKIVLPPEIEQAIRKYNGYR